MVEPVNKYNQVILKVVLLTGGLCKWGQLDSKLTNGQNVLDTEARWSLLTDVV